MTTWFQIIRCAALFLTVGLAAAQSLSDSAFSIVLDSCTTSGTPDVDPFSVQVCNSRLTIPRVVGPGSGPANINPDGTLVNPDRYVAHGIVSATASLHWVVTASGYAGSTVILTVSVNGTQVAVGYAPALTSISGYTDLPINLLRFGQIVKGANQPGVNQVTTTVVIQFTPQPPCTGGGCRTTAATLRPDAGNSPFLDLRYTGLSFTGPRSDSSDGGGQQLCKQLGAETGTNPIKSPSCAVRLLPR
jgi:hypothetical protein